MIRINPPANTRLQQSGAEAIYDGSGALFVKAYLRNGHYQDTIWKILPNGSAEVVWSPPDTHSGSNGMFLDPQGRLWHLGANSAIPSYLKAEMVPGFVPLPPASAGSPPPSSDVVQLMQTVATLVQNQTILMSRVTSLQNTVDAQAVRIRDLEARAWNPDLDWQQANSAIRNFFDAEMQIPALIGGKATFEQYIRDIIWGFLLKLGLVKG